MKKRSTMVSSRPNTNDSTIAVNDMPMRMMKSKAHVTMTAITAPLMSNALSW